MTDNRCRCPELTLLQRRLIDAAVEIIEDQADSVEYLHSVLCQVGLPRAQRRSGHSAQQWTGRQSRLKPGSCTGAGQFVAAPCHTEQNLVWC